MKDKRLTEGRCRILGRHLDVQRVNIRKASENAGKHLGLLKDAKVHPSGPEGCTGAPPSEVEGSY
jgi:hypothetical protein